jgi:hypothetical protein
MRYADQPITAIGRRTKDHLLASELPKGIAYVASRHAWNI